MTHSYQYQKQGVSLDLKTVLARLNNKPTPLPKAIVYSSQDKTSANKVLTRLLAQAASNEVTSITKISENIDE